MNYRLDIQGVRALAILMVVISHAKLGIFPGGFVGVDVFFVLSGYLITGLLFCEYTNTKQIKYFTFIAKRLRRLLPSLMAMVCLVVISSRVILSSSEIIAQMGSATYAVSWLSNFYFAFSNFDYFSELQIRDLFLHTWSLGVEEQFYLVWPVFVWFILAINNNKNITTSLFNVQNITLIILFVLSFCLSFFWLVNEPIWAYYLMPSRVWQFALGAAVCLCFKRRGVSVIPVLAKLQPGLWLIGLSALIISAIFITPEMQYPGYLALVPSIGTALLLMSNTEGLGYRLLSSKTLVWLGDRSYALYLWHWPILMFGFSLGFENDLTVKFGLLLLAVFMAMLSYRFIELPFWKGKLSRFSVSKTIFVSLVTILLVVLSITNFLNFTEKNNVLSGTDLKIRSDVPPIYANGCDTWYKSADVRPCIVGFPEAPRTVVMLGDSILGQWFSVIPMVFKSPEWKIIVLTKSSCPMVDEKYYYQRIGRNYDVCEIWRKNSLEYVANVKADVVIIGNASSYGFSGQQLMEGSTRILRELSNTVGKTIVIPATPTLPFDGPSCLEKAANASWFRNVISKWNECTVKGRITHIESVTNIMEQSTKGVEGVMFMNLNDLVCPNGVCSAKSNNGLVVFRDSQHLTNSFVVNQASKVRDRLVDLGIKLN
jgi:peptidoglycan/LPS O-acetylase OafA/YrhL